MNNYDNLFYMGLDKNLENIVDQFIIPFCMFISLVLLIVIHQPINPMKFRQTRIVKIRNNCLCVKNILKIH